MRKSIKPIFIICLNMAVCMVLGLLPLFIFAALLLMISKRFKFSWLWILPALGLVLIRLPQDHLIVGVGASVILMQLWSILRQKSFKVVEPLAAVTWFASLPAGPIHRDSKLVENVRWVWPQGSVYLLLAQGFLKCGIGIFLSQHLQGIETLILRGSFPTILVLSLISVLLFYCQLSGLSDLAVGISKFFKVDLPLNFDQPMKASDLPDFWRRWHISLNQWFFHEVYLPLAMFFRGHFRSSGSFVLYPVLIFTALLIGLWHGFNGALVFWGILNGLLLVIYSSFKGTFARILSWIAVLFLFLIMRFESGTSLIGAADRLFLFRYTDLERAKESFMIFFVCLGLLLFLGESWKWKEKFWPILVSIYLFAGFLLGHSDGSVLYPGF